MKLNIERKEIDYKQTLISRVYDTLDHVYNNIDELNDI